MDNKQPARDPLNAARDPLNAAIALTLSHAQLDADLTDVALAKETGLTVQTLRRYLKGERLMPAGAFVRITAALDVDPTDIITAARKRLSE